MILRRVITHFRKQEWTAIAIDFVIVVLGVFVGIQVSNWNAARELRASERNHLAQLREEIATNIRLIDSHQTYTQAVVDSGRRALAFLDGDGNCGDGCAGLLIDFFHSSQLWGTPYRTAKFDENTRLGFPANEAVRAIVDNFYLNIAGWNPINLTAPPYRATIRGYFTPDAAAVLWDECFVVPEDQLERVSRDCEDQLDKADAASMLRAIHADRTVGNGLRFWVGQNLFALTEFDNTRAAAQKSVAALDAEIGAAP